MKTPRQFLFLRHRSAKPKLDAIRATTLTEMRRANSQSREEKILAPLTFFASWRELLLSLRWHFTAMSAVWLLALLLNMDRLTASAPTVAIQNAPSPQQLVTALLENRRQIAELTASPSNGPQPVAVPQSFIPPRRSEFSSPTEMA